MEGPGLRVTEAESASGDVMAEGSGLAAGSCTLRGGDALVSPRTWPHTPNIIFLFDVIESMCQQSRLPPAPADLTQGTGVCWKVSMFPLMIS